MIYVRYTRIQRLTLNKWSICPFVCVCVCWFEKKEREPELIKDWDHRDGSIIWISESVTNALPLTMKTNSHAVKNRIIIIITVLSCNKLCQSDTDESTVFIDGRGCQMIRIKGNFQSKWNWIPNILLTTYRSNRLISFTNSDKITVKKKESNIHNALGISVQIEWKKKKKKNTNQKPTKHQLWCNFIYKMMWCNPITTTKKYTICYWMDEEEKREHRRWRFDMETKSSPKSMAY